MNKVFKVIWSEARNAYVVVSEIAKNHGSKSCSTKKLLTMLIATGVMTCASMAPAMADNPAPNDLNVTIGKGAHVSVWNGVSGQTISGDIAVGPNAHAWNGEYTYDDKYARIGTKEYLMDFGQGAVETVTDLKWGFWPVTNYKVKDGSKIAGSIAIGKNTIARTGSVMLGDHSYTGKLGDIEINPKDGAMTYNDGIYSTTLGAGAYNSGSLAAVTGALSIASGKDTKNTGATIYGSMNSIESATSDSSYSGVASSVLGFANRTQNANAALIWGTGNEVTNSVEEIGIDTNWNKLSVAEAQQKAIEAMQSSKYAGGSVMAIGGGNKADYAKYSQLTGVQNKVTGTKAKAAKYDLVNGYQNTVFNASDVTVIGIKNKVTADGNKVIGDNHEVSGKDNVIFGSADKLTETTVNNAVVLGHNAKVTGEGGVALGAGSVADRANAVSVGSKGAERQIINVAKGTEDTDAVNVSQLKDVKAEALKHSTVTNGDNNITVTEGFNKDGGKEYNVALKNDIYLEGDDPNAFVSISGSKGTIWTSGKVTAGSVEAGSVVMDGATATVSGLGNTTTAYDGFATTGKAATEEQLKEIAKVADNANQGWNLSTNGNAASKVAPGETVDFSGDKNISVSNNGKDVKVKLNKDLDVDSVQTNVLNAKYNLSIGTANENGTMPFFVNSNGAFYAANGKLVVDKDGKVTATEGEIGNVVLKNGVLYKNTALRDGELYVGDADGNYSQITPKSAKLGQVTIDEKGNIAGVNSVQTNALNAKYNLSVGTANENGTVPFFVNSNGAFYAANGKLVVDKDGKVTATEGEIGNVVLKNGVLYKNTALRDGELYVGDASGNYSQITTKGAKLGKVTIAADGKIHGVTAGTADTDAVNVSQLKAVGATANMGWNLSTNGVATEATNVKPGDFVDFSGDKNISVKHDGAKVQVELNKDIDVNSVQTNALNAKYNLSVGTANANGIMPFFVNSTGAFYAANNNFSVDKDGKVTATAGEIGNVVLNNGVFTGHSALRDGELFVGDASGNYSQITTKGAKLGKVTIDEQGNIAGANHIQTNALNAKYNLSVGTANANGIMPFFVNSNGAFYAANNNFSVDKDGKVIATAGEIGNVVLKDGVFYKNTALRDGELFVGDASGNYSQITTKGAKLGKVTVAEDGKISGVAAGAITADSTDAVNGSQLHAVATEAGKHSKVVSGNNINVEETDVDGQKFYKVNMNKDIMLGDLTGKNVSISGTNGTIETTGYIATQDRVYADKGAKLADIDVTGNKISNGASSIVLDGSNVKVNDKVTIDQNGKISGVAAGEVSSTSTDAINGSQLYQTNENVAQNKADIAQNKADIAQNKADIAQNKADIAQNKADIAQNKADIAQNKADIAQNKADIATNKADIAQNKADIAQNKTDIKNLDNRVTNVEELAKKHTTVTAGDNITVAETTNADGGKEYKVALNKDISVDSVKAGDTTITDKGLEIKDGPSVTKDGINAGNKKITGVAKGEADTDAVNYGQLKETNNHIDRVENQVVSNTNRINQLGSRVNKVGAGAAALAALHPMDFDPDDKLTFSAGYGNYGGENAAAIGAYYRPDEKVMFSVGGTVGNGENMVNAGVSFSLDRTNHVSNSRTAMAREILDLRAEVTELKAMVAKGGLGSIAEDKMKIFPDVAENHWAYEYVGKLAAAGIIEGYPDGKFSGDRMMSRYEFAAMLYRAMQKGAQLDSKIINEFAPEMGRIRVDRISGEDGDRDKIERVRVNAVKGERDHYGNKIAKAEAKAK